MSRLILALLISPLVSDFAYGSNCLEEATNSALLNELDRRLTGGSGNSRHAAVDLSCLNSTLHIYMITESATEAQHTVKTKFSSDCENYLHAIGSTLKITSLKVVAICNGAELHRVALLPSGIKPLQIQKFRFSSDCENKADEINRLL